VNNTTSKSDNDTDLTLYLSFW